MGGPGQPTLLDDVKKYNGCIDPFGSLSASRIFRTEYTHAYHTTCANEYYQQ